MKSTALAAAVLLVATRLSSLWAADPVPSKSDVEALREDIAHLKERIEKLEGLLRARGVLPPSKAIKPDAWTEVEIRLDNNGKPSIAGNPVTIADIKKQMAAIFESGKCPSVRLVAPQQLAFHRIRDILVVLDYLAVPDVSIIRSD